MEALIQMIQAQQALFGGGAAAIALAAIAAFALTRKRPALEEDDELASLDDSPGEPPSSHSEAPRGPSVFERFRVGLSRTSAALGAVFGREAVDEGLFEALEEALIGADVGVRTATSIIEDLRGIARREQIQEPEQLRGRLRELIETRLSKGKPGLEIPANTKPYVVLVVGVNGSGKTTTIGKLSARFKEQGLKVLVGAGDTFRAGAIEQLKVWADRSGVDFVAHQAGADPSAVLFDALKAGQARGADVVLCDTAGRLQSQRPLMDELGKVTRVIGKACPGAPHEVLLVLDATIGQNALSQARTFGAVTGVTGVVLTKLDGTAKGGVVVAVEAELGLPVRFIGVGEGIDDLRPFDAEAFARALVGEA